MRTTMKRIYHFLAAHRRSNPRSQWEPRIMPVFMHRPSPTLIR